MKKWFPEILYEKKKKSSSPFFKVSKTFSPICSLTEVWRPGDFVAEVHSLFQNYIIATMPIIKYFSTPVLWNILIFLCHRTNTGFFSLTCFARSRRLFLSFTYFGLISVGRPKCVTMFLGQQFSRLGKAGNAAWKVTFFSIFYSYTRHCNKERLVFFIKGLWRNPTGLKFFLFL